MVVFKEKMRVGPKGQVVIPQEFRKKLNIKPGSAVIVGYTDHGLVIEKMIDDPVAVFRMVAKKGTSVKSIDSDKDYEEMLEERWKKATKST
ncbi:MAG TPA: AbrB/MazE/SpoVT family DNA-binding domain-containing protein [Candidatus Nanoarchaeia archaeon]|nr:AbrB/MazE/SpoVT family DNA-binding domain-containing protein [Candidatus Nanoarchaeia archaeon]